MISNYILKFMLIPIEKYIPRPSSKKLHFTANRKYHRKITSGHDTEINRMWKHQPQWVHPVTASLSIYGSGNTTEEEDIKTVKA